MLFFTTEIYQTNRFPSFSVSDPPLISFMQLWRYC